jgi:hypothetical protein
MNHSFSNNPQIATPRSLFDRSHAYKTTFNHGQLIPFFWDEVLPGDTMKLRASILARVNTLLFPLMDNIKVQTHFFFVPYRIIWDNSKKFFGEQDNPGDSIAYTVPQLLDNGTGWAEGTVCDYLGLPIGISGLSVSALPYRAYHEIYDEWYRDQNLINSVDLGKSDSPKLSDGGFVQLRGKRHDYFTSCLTSPQKGTAVDLPLGSTAPVQYKTGVGNAAILRKASDDSLLAGGSNLNLGAAATTSNLEYDTGSIDAFLDPNGTLEVDLSSATASTVADIREAFQTQKFLERDARGGTRYSEVIKNHFGVDFFDNTYRPEFLGGGTSFLNVNQVATTADSGSAEVGDLSAYGIASGNNHGFNRSFNEHGIVMGIISTVQDLTYQYGVERAFLRTTRYDFYWPTLAHLGEQAVTNIEIYAQSTSADDQVFGYQERYAEYRYKPSKVTGALRSNAAAPLDEWHLAEEHVSLPTLGSTFISETGVIERCIATPSEPHYILDAYFDYKCARPMPVFGVPGMIDHF